MKYSRHCRICEIAFLTKSPWTLLCSSTCREISKKKSWAKYKRTSKGVVATRRWARSEQQRLRSSVTYRRLRAQLISKFGMCAACHSEERLTIDHIRPLSMGGKHEIENLQVLCSACNCKKRQETIRYELPQVQQDVN